MKKKIFFASATVLFAVATVFNMNLLQGNSVGDVSLESKIMNAIAQSEAPPSPDVWYRRGYWTEIKGKRIVTLTADVDMWVVTKAGLAHIKAGGTYQVEEEYAYWDCIGWSGRC